MLYCILTLSRAASPIACHVGPPWLLSKWSLVCSWLEPFTQGNENVQRANEASKLRSGRKNKHIMRSYHEEGSYNRVTGCLKACVDYLWYFLHFKMYDICISFESIGQQKTLAVYPIRKTYVNRNICKETAHFKVQKRISGPLFQWNLHVLQNSLCVIELRGWFDFCTIKA